MKKRNIILGLILSVVFLTHANGAKATSCDSISEEAEMLPVLPTTQPCQYWNWAAVMEMISAYFGIDVKQCEFVSYLTSEQCCYWKVCDYKGCEYVASNEEINAILEELGIVSEFRGRALVEEQLQEELKNRRPVLVRFKSLYIGTFGVISGFIPATKHAPAYYNFIDAHEGETCITYNQLRNEYGGINSTWGYSWLGIKLPEVAWQLD